MKRLLFIFIIFLYALNIYGQDGTFFIGDKTYPCSSEYTFDKWNFANQLTFFIVKDGNKGMIVFKTSFYRVCGTVILYLDNNTLIKLLDRKAFDLVNNEYSSIFYFTESEITTLKSINISSVRYNQCFSEGDGSAHSVDNKDKTGPFNNKEIIKKIDCPEIIKALFD